MQLWDAQLNVSVKAILAITVSRSDRAVAFTWKAEAGVSVLKDEAVVSVFISEAVVSVLISEAVGVGELTMGSISIGSSSPASTR